MPKHLTWTDINFGPINLWSAPAMRNYDADKRANSLKLRPTRPQTNSFRYFHFDPPKQDMDYVEGERMALCRELRNRRG